MYAVDRKNIWHKYELENGHFKPTNDSFMTDEAKTVSATFDAAGKNVYVMAYDAKGYSVIVQYRFDAATGLYPKSIRPTFQIPMIAPTRGSCTCNLDQKVTMLMRSTEKVM